MTCFLGPLRPQPEYNLIAVRYSVYQLSVIAKFATHGASNYVPEMPTGRPSDFTPELGDAICDAMLAKVSLRAIEQMEGMPHRNTILRWLTQFPAFADKYARARQVQADLLDDEIQVASDQANVEDWQLHRMRIETMKWRAGRMAPQKYGERVALTGADGGPIAVTVARFTGEGPVTIEGEVVPQLVGQSRGE